MQKNNLLSCSNTQHMLQVMTCATALRSIGFKNKQEIVIWNATGELSVTCPLLCYLASCLDWRSKYYDTWYDGAYLLVSFWRIFTKARWLMSLWHSCPWTPGISFPEDVFSHLSHTVNCYAIDRNYRGGLSASTLSDVCLCYKDMEKISIGSV